MLLLSAPVELSCFNLAAPRKGNPCVAFGHHLLRWPGDSGHGGEVPGSWHGRAAKPALGKCWQPAEQPRYKLGPISHQVLLPGQAAPPGPWPSPVPLLALAQGRSSPGRQRLPDHVRSGGGFAPQSPAEDTAAEISSLGWKGRWKKRLGGTGRSWGCPAWALAQGTKHNSYYEAMHVSHFCHQTLLAPHVYYTTGGWLELNFSLVTRLLTPALGGKWDKNQANLALPNMEGPPGNCREAQELSAIPSPASACAAGVWTEAAT